MSYKKKENIKYNNILYIYIIDHIFVTYKYSFCIKSIVCNGYKHNNKIKL